jgi:ABC-2 type transport system ATP-binding protein
MYLRQLLRRHAQTGGVALVSTHLLDMAEQICDRILVIDRGRTVACGTPAELRAKAAVSPNASLETAFLRLVAS